MAVTMNKHVNLDVAWTGQADCGNCSLRSSVLFAGLTESDFEKIHAPIEQLDLTVGGYLYRAGDSADALFTVRSGMLKLVQYLPDGKQRIVRLVRNTDITGLEAVVGGHYQHDAIALQNTEICVLPAKVIHQLSAENDDLRSELMGRWQQALNEADSWITQLSTGSAIQRVARLLLYKLCGNAENECGLPLREDIAAILGISTETASRTIAEFRRQGVLIETTPQNFKINLDKLEQVAN